MLSLSVYIRRIVTIGLTVSVILLLPSCEYFRQKLHFGKYSLKEANEWARADSARIADSLKRVIPEKRVPDKRQTDSVKRIIAEKKVFERTLTDSLMAVDTKNRPEAKTAPGYYIIVGTFSNHNYSLQAVEKYKSNGFKPIIIKESGDNGTRLEMVSVKTFNKSEEAHEFLQGFKDKYDPGAWVYAVR